jgi:hypothetical protein
MNSLLLVQGSLPFLRALPASYLRHSVLLVACEGDPLDLSHPAWFKAAYDFSAYGGVAAGDWLYVSTFVLPSSLSS